MQVSIPTVVDFPAADSRLLPKNHEIFQVAQQLPVCYHIHLWLCGQV
jgi:hypothetical protein